MYWGNANCIRKGTHLAPTTVNCLLITADKSETKGVITETSRMQKRSEGKEMSIDNCPKFRDLL